MKGTWARIGVGLTLGLMLAAVGLSAEARPRVKHDRAADEHAIIDGERAWGQAYVTGDVAAIRRLLAESFRGVDPRGAVYGKAEAIRDVQAGPRGTSDEVGPVTVRFFGDTAVAQAREHEVGPAPERKAVERVFTDTWVRGDDGRWRIFAAEDLEPGQVAAAPAGEASGEGGFDKAVYAYAVGAYADDKRSILALREANNRALAAHNLDAAMSIVADNYVVTGGDGGIDRSVADNRKAWSAEFARTSYDRYVRTPTGLEVGERKGVLRAAESGTWEGLDHMQAGEARPYGRYFVHWSKASGHWRVVSESYVTLGCHGAGC